MGLFQFNHSAKSGVTLFYEKSKGSLWCNAFVLDNCGGPSGQTPPIRHRHPYLSVSLPTCYYLEVIFMTLGPHAWVKNMCRKFNSDT